MSTTEQLGLLAEFWRRYVVEGGFRLWYVHANPGAQPKPLTAQGKMTGGVWGGTADVHPALLELGYPTGVCCYEVGLHLPGCTAG